MDNPPKAHHISSGRDARAPGTPSYCRAGRAGRAGRLDPELHLSPSLQPTASAALRRSVTSMCAGVWVIAIGGRAERTAT